MNDGCIIGTRIISSAQYHIDDGRSLIAWFDRSGNDTNGHVVHSDPNRRVITTQVGQTILYRGKALKVVKAAPCRQNWLTPEDRAANMRR